MKIDMSNPLKLLIPLIFGQIECTRSKLILLQGVRLLPSFFLQLSWNYLQKFRNSLDKKIWDYSFTLFWPQGRFFCSDFICMFFFEKTKWPKRGSFQNKIWISRISHFWISKKLVIVNFSEKRGQHLKRSNCSFLKWWISHFGGFAWINWWKWDNNVSFISVICNDISSVGFISLDLGLFHYFDSLRRVEKWIISKKSLG